MEETIGTSGFYKKDNGDWIYAPNFVLSKNYTLSRGGDRTSTDGWVWYDEAPKEYLDYQVINDKYAV